MVLGDRKEGMLILIIHQYIAVGSHIKSCCCKSYQSITDYSYDQKMVNYSKIYKAPDGTHTNQQTLSGEGWRWIFQISKRKKNFDENLFILVWWYQNQKGLWAYFLIALTTVEYTCGDGLDDPLYEEDQVVGI